MDKSAIFFSKNTKDETRIAICNELERIVEKRSSKYLGLPMLIAREIKEASIQFCQRKSDAKSK